MYLPSIYNSEEFVGEVRDTLSLKWQLKNKVKVAAGGADNACAALGAGIVSSDIALVSIGTSGVFLSKILLMINIKGCFIYLIMLSVVVIIPWE